jgi:hypothetical protein
MTNAGMTNDERMTNPEGRMTNRPGEPFVIWDSSFDILLSLVIPAFVFLPALAGFRAPC